MSGDEMDIGFLLKQLHLAITRNADQNLKPVTVSQMRVLVFLLHQPNHTCCQRDIETHFEVSHPTVVGLIQRLEAKGLIHTVPSTQDRRRKDICITDDGMHILQDANAHRVALEQQLCKGLTDEDLRRLRQLLVQLYQNISEHPSLEDEPTPPHSRKEGVPAQHG